MFVANNLTLGDLAISSTNNSVVVGTPSGSGGVGPAVAFLAKGTIQVQGRVLVASGAVNLSGCTSPSTPNVSVGNATYVAGAGGGGHATAGADGGDVPNGATHLAHGAASGTDQLVPLRGGCPAGGTAGLPGELVGRGGGAIQLVSEVSIDISGTIVADGLVTQLNDGTGGINYGGGGGGGGILLEAPNVTLGLSGKLLARGGGGAAGDFQTGIEAPDAATPIPGGVSAVHDGTRSNGGAGGTDTVAPVAGTNTAPVKSGESVIRIAGGGGGGVGRIRINTADATVDKQSSSVLAGRVTTGVVAAQ